MQDILLDENFDVQITDGDFVIGESAQQQQQLLMITNKGEWKENPTVGVGVSGFLKDDVDTTDLLAEVKTQFEADGMTVNELNYDNNGNIKIDAAYDS